MMDFPIVSFYLLRGFYYFSIFPYYNGRTRSLRAISIFAFSVHIRQKKSNGSFRFAPFATSFLPHIHSMRSDSIVLRSRLRFFRWFVPRTLCYWLESQQRKSIDGFFFTVFPCFFPGTLITGKIIFFSFNRTIE